MIKLSKRLYTIASLVPINSKVVDVGCDHAYLSIYLAQNKIASKIYATDINENAYNIAKQNITSQGLDKTIKIKLGDGLLPIKNEDVNTAIISGMGSKTIIDILNKSTDVLTKINTLIISSNTDLYYLRKNLIKLNYYIEKEIMLKDKNIYYTIIKLSKGTKKYTHNELVYGPVLLKKKDKVLKEYLINIIKKQKSIIKNIPNTKLLLKLKLIIKKSNILYILKKISSQWI